MGQADVACTMKSFIVAGALPLAAVLAVKKRTTELTMDKAN